MNLKDTVVKIVANHKAKSEQIKQLKKALKRKSMNTISVSHLKMLLGHEESYNIDHRDYYSWGEYDDNAYSRDEARKEARIELLKELIGKR